MKRLATILGIIASLAIGQVATASATSLTLEDKALNWDTWVTNPNVNNNIDGNSVTPDIKSTTVTYSEAQKLQSIVFNLNTHNYNVKSGDLFIDLGANQTWDYVVKALYTPLNSSATLSLYKINVGLHQDEAYVKSFYNSNVYSYRPGLPIGLNQGFYGELVQDYSVSYLADASKISFNFGSSPFVLGGDFIIGYTETCANDVIYQKVPVPEPGTMVLLGAGLLGLAIYGKRRMGKEA